MDIKTLREENKLIDLFCNLAQIPSPSLGEETLSNWIVDYCKTNNINMQQLQQKVNKLKVELGNNDDVIVRNFLLNKKNASIIFVNSVVDVQIINNTILKALFEYANLL